MDLAEEYNAGSSSLELARKYGLTKRAVLYRLRKQGVKRRTTSQALRRFTVNEAAFQGINCESTAYWLGFLLADGAISCTGRFSRARQLRCTLQERDLQHLEMLRTWLCSTHPIKYLPDKKAYLLSITSKRLVEPLEAASWHEFKRFGHTAILEITPSNLQRHLIRGLIDGDGTIGYYLGRWIIGYIDLHETVVKWVQSWFIRNCNTKPVKLRRPSQAFQFQYNGNIQAPRIIYHLYANAAVALSRKSERAAKAIQLHLSRLSSKNPS